MDNNLKRITGTALCIALGLVIPFIFHAIGLGSTFTPLHFPVLLCGFCFGPFCGFICGLIVPYLSSFLTGMPPLFPIAFTMTFECGIYGLFAGILYRMLKSNIYVSLIGAMLAGRIIGGLVSFSVYGISNYSLAAYFTAYFINNIPGIILNIIVIPILVLALEKAKLISKPIKMEN